jgi:hypothetical protein
VQIEERGFHFLKPLVLLRRMALVYGNGCRLILYSSLKYSVNNKDFFAEQDGSIQMAQLF